MKHLFLHDEGNRELLLFFSGWGMDVNPFGHLRFDGLDVLMFFDYTDTETPIDFVETATRYDRVQLTAWSLGVWAAREAMANTNLSLASATAINGTLQPISAEYGIAPEVFQGTLDSWSKAGRKRFERRMCRGQMPFFSAHRPARETEEQKRELAALHRRIAMPAPPDGMHYSTAVTGRDDRIFTADAQRRFWQEAGVPVRELDAPHYCFGAFESWREVADLGQA